MGAEVWDKVLDKDTLGEFSPVRLDQHDYQFTVGEYTVRAFNFEIPARGPWSAEIVISDNNNTLWRDIIFPQKRDWHDKLGRSNVAHQADLERFLFALAHSYNKAQNVVRDLSLEYHTGRESLDLESWPLPEQVEIVPDFAVQGGYTILFGEPGVGKSVLVHNIGLRSAGGIKHLLAERKRDPIVVYYLSIEMGEIQLRQRHNELVKHVPEPAQDNFVFSCPDSFDFTNPRDKSMLTNTLAKIGAKLLIVDGHTYWIGNKDDNSNSEMSDYIVVPMTKLAKQLELGIILVHHSGWSTSERIRGASVLWVGAEIGILMETDPTTPNCSTLSFKKWRPAFKRMPRPITYSYDPSTYRIAKAGESDFVMELELPAKRSEVIKQIAGITGVEVRQARNKLKTLISQDYLHKDDKGYICNPDHNMGIG